MDDDVSRFEDDLAACQRSLRATVSAITQLLQADGRSPAESARPVRQWVDAILSELLGETLTEDAMKPATRAVYNALLTLEDEPGQPFMTRRVAIAMESNLRPMTADCQMYELERLGVITRNGQPGKGTTVQILRRVA